jgi:hypothetical protein
VRLLSRAATVGKINKMEISLQRKSRELKGSNKVTMNKSVPHDEPT